MARSSDPNSAGSQFFICLDPQPGLDGQYSVFGQVTEGQDVVDKIGALPTDRRDRPQQEAKMEKVYIELAE
jgi:cyclophilin family peptidyl-prolyl cis-trans isomerase